MHSSKWVVIILWLFVILYANIVVSFKTEQKVESEDASEDCTSDDQNVIFPFLRSISCHLVDVSVFICSENSFSIRIYICLMLWAC